MAGFGIGRATADDLEALLPLVASYHAVEGIATTAAGRAAALSPLLGGLGPGEVWAARSGDRRAGYLAVCFGYSIEFGGKDAFVDELFVAPGSRGRGIATSLLREAVGALGAAGVRALHLEVERQNAPALRLYTRAGFSSRDRYHLMSRRLGPAAGTA